MPGNYKGNNIMTHTLETSKGPATFHKGRPLMDCPTTYRKVAVVGLKNQGLYSPSYFTLFKARDGSLRYEIYRDGNFAPFYGKVEFQA